MEEIIVQLFEASALGATIVAVSWFVHKVLLKLLDNLAQARELEAKREEGELEQSRKLESTLVTMNGELALSRQATALLIERIENLPTKSDMQQVGATMRDWSNAHDAKLSNVHDVVNEIQPGIGAQLAKFKEEIEKLISDMQTSISIQIQTGSQNTQQACTMLEEMQTSLQTMVGHLEKLTKGQD